MHYGTAAEVGPCRAEVLDAASPPSPADSAAGNRPAEAAHRHLDQRARPEALIKSNSEVVSDCLTASAVRVGEGWLLEEGVGTRARKATIWHMECSHLAGAYQICYGGPILAKVRDR